MIALIRPDDWNFPLFLHVLGATLLFGGALIVATFALAARVRAEPQAELLRRLGFLTTLTTVWPAYVLMRVGAQWVYAKEDPDPENPPWIATGLVVADGGIILLLVLTLLGWLAVRRKPRLVGVVAGLAVLYLVALGVAWWAMSTRVGGSGPA